MQKHLNFSLSIVIVTLVAAAVLGLFYWQLVQENKTFDWQKFAFVHKDIEVDTSDWLTYRNEKYGWEIKYPKEWYHVLDSTIREGKEIDFFGNRKPPYENSYFGMQGREPGLLFNIMLNKDRYLTRGELFSSKNILIADEIWVEQKVYRQIYPNGKGDEYVLINFNKDKNYYTIEAELYLDYVMEYRNIFDVIVSTFKFN
jgi:hypothetical protein